MYSASVLFSNPGVVELPGLSIAADVNDSRVVVAWNVLLDLNTMRSTTVPLPPGNWQGMIASDISNAGGICGSISGFSGCSTFPVRRLSGSPMEIIGGCATTTSAVSMNDRGDALTYVYNGGLGVVFIDHGYTDITGLIAPSEAPWAVTGVSTINNARQMLVTGRIAPTFAPTLLRLTPIVAGDLDEDGRVAGSDLGALLAAWGVGSGPADLDHNGVVDGSDLGALLAAWTG
jgi:hypothetical protein